MGSSRLMRCVPSEASRSSLPPARLVHTSNQVVPVYAAGAGLSKSRVFRGHGSRLGQIVAEHPERRAAARSRRVRSGRWACRTLRLRRGPDAPAPLSLSLVCQGPDGRFAVARVLVSAAKDRFGTARTSRQIAARPGWLAPTQPSSARPGPLHARAAGCCGTLPGKRARGSACRIQVCSTPDSGPPAERRGQASRVLSRCSTESGGPIDGWRLVAIAAPAGGWR